MDYRVIEYKEILHEAFAGLLAEISYIISQKENSLKSDDPLYFFKEKTAAIWREIIGDKYSTMDDMIKLKGQYELIQSYIKGIS